MMLIIFVSIFTICLFEFCIFII